jgi:hypothetical protein
MQKKYLFNFSLEKSDSLGFAFFCGVHPGTHSPAKPIEIDLCSMPFGGRFGGMGWPATRNAGV